MRLTKYSICCITGLLFFFWFFTSSASAATTPFRSAGAVTTDGSVSYTNIQNCTVTDGLTCNRALATGFGNLYFSGFGNYSNFGMPDGSVITHVRTRVTGKSQTQGLTLHVTLFRGSSSCITSPSDLWTAWNLLGGVINTQIFVSPVVQTFQPQSVFANCLHPTNFPSIFWRINYSSSQLWSANIDNLEVAFDYTPPPPTPTPTATPTPTPTPAKTPLIIIPGIGGSELKVTNGLLWDADDGHGGTYTHLYNANEIVWVNEEEAQFDLQDDYFDVLRMKPDGDSLVNISTTGHLFAGAYQPTINSFVENGYVLGETLFVFPYDWRKDIRHTLPLLEEKIDTIKQQSGSGKVDIVAHSMGGLVARHYISDPSRAQNIKRLFTLGTPHLGAVNSISKLMYGDCLTPFPIQTPCFGVSGSEVNDVIQNMISSYQLAPSQAYFTFYSGVDASRPFPFADERDMDNNGITGSLNYLQIKNLLTNLGHNTSLFTPSEAFHSLDSILPTTNGVRVINIVGSGIPTLGQIIEKNIINFLGITITKKDQVFVNGDETVPLFSASLIDSEKNRSLLGNAEVYYTKQDHGKLVTPGSALEFINSIINNDLGPTLGISTTPYTINGTIFSVHSPINIHVYDDNGNHTGLTAEGFEEGIPGSTYDTLGDAKFVFLPEDGVYTVKLDATGEGSFDFKIREYENDVNTKTILYKDVPLTIDTTGETMIDTTSEVVPILHMDENDDGIVDSEEEHFSVAEGGETHDNTPPVLSLDVNPKSIWSPNNKMIDIRITGTITDEHPYLTQIVVDDEYDVVEPTITKYYETTIDLPFQLEASRRGDDKDGRKYKIKILVTDVAGNTSLSTFDVVVPHDQQLNIKK